MNPIYAEYLSCRKAGCDLDRAARAVIGDIPGWEYDEIDDWGDNLYVVLTCANRFFAAVSVKADCAVAIAYAHHDASEDAEVAVRIGEDGVAPAVWQAFSRLVSRHPASVAEVAGWTTRP